MPPNQHGSYLIRNSISNPGGYSLSIRDGEEVKHYKIEQLENGAFYLHERITFKSVVDLISHYQSKSDGLPVRLIHPCIVLGKTMEIDRRQIKIVKKLWKREFSEVWEGVWNDSIEIRIKKHNPHVLMTQSDFLQMASLMKKLHHSKIIQLYGTCTRVEPIYIITEAMMHGNLLKFLARRSQERPKLTLHRLINISKQVAEGMAYLEDENIIHRDLAARNILIGENLNCKVANFETAVEVDESGSIFESQSQTKRFTLSKWTAPEAASQKKFSIKSDVWSFGIFLYEVITHGQPPYPHMTIVQVLESVQQGYRIPQPYKCPEELYKFMLSCWQGEAVERPAFRALHWKLEKYSRETDPEHAIFASIDELA